MATGKPRSVLAVASAVLLLITLLTLAAVPTAGGSTPEGDYEIALKSRTFTPSPGVDKSGIRSGKGPRDDVHFFAQFEELPNAPRRAEIADRGVELLDYVVGNTYIASASVAELSVLDELEDLRWAGPIADDDKISPALRRGEIGKWAKAGNGRIVISAQGHRDVGVDHVSSLIEASNGEVVSEAPTTRTAVAIVPPGHARRLAKEDAIQFLSVVEPRLGETNDGASANLNVDALRQAPYGLDGSGVTALVFDVAQVDASHPDFGTRVLESDSSGLANHATHVAGTLAGSGANSNGNDSDGNANGGAANQWMGMAPNANLRSFGLEGSGDVLYNDPGDINADFTTAIGNGIDLSNMSLGNNVVSNGFPCGQLGDYTDSSILMDEIVRGSIDGQQLIAFHAAGNERQSGAPCGNFSTIGSPSTAKNPIVVGNIYSDDDTLRESSSFGPTDDGRLKPDVVAPGCQRGGDGGIMSTTWEPRAGMAPRQNGYGTMCGTSMASPAAAGSTALLIERWQQLNGAATRPLSHTAKAILVHTARDLGNAGPDYQFGWGAVEAQAAVDLVNADDSDPLIHVDSTDQGDETFWTFNSDGSDDVRVTLVWDDPPAAQLAASTLINNLDLRLIGPDGVEREPFLLDPNNTGNVATTGNDTRNNVEVVEADAAEGTWTVRVDGTAVPDGPQQFTLITPEGAVENRPPTADAGGPYETDEGVDVDVDAGGSSDPDGDALTYAWDFDDDGQFDDATGETATFDLVGFRGTYPIAVRVTDSNGAFDIDATTVTVNNVAPSVDEIVTNSPIAEGEALTISGSASDPGWLTNLDVTVDWGDPEFPDEVLSGTQENDRPDATFEFSGSNVYGDNGTFTVTVCADDGVAEVCDTVEIEVDNVAPTLEIDLSGATDVNGTPTLFGQIGEPFEVSGNATDPGSDDLLLSWFWGDGAVTATNYPVNPPGADPFPSPSVQPRDVDDTQSHTYTDACFYTVVFFGQDDDGGLGSDDVAVVIGGDADRARSAGYWLANYRGVGTQEFSEDTLQCYLDIVGHVSQVFHEETDASTIELAAGVLHPKNAAGAMIVQLDRQLLALWLNFANGAIGYDELVDTDGDGVVDTALSEVLAAAETARLDPTATTAELEHHKNIIERINLQDQ